MLLSTLTLGSLFTVLGLPPMATHAQTQTVPGVYTNAISVKFPRVAVVKERGDYSRLLLKLPCAWGVYAFACSEFRRGSLYAFTK